MLVGWVDITAKSRLLISHLPPHGTPEAPNILKSFSLFSSFRNLPPVTHLSSGKGESPRRLCSRWEGKCPKSTTHGFGHPLLIRQYLLVFEISGLIWGDWGNENETSQLTVLTPFIALERGSASAFNLLRSFFMHVY